MKSILYLTLFLPYFCMHAMHVSIIPGLVVPDDLSEIRFAASKQLSFALLSLVKNASHGDEHLEKNIRFLLTLGADINCKFDHSFKSISDNNELLRMITSAYTVAGVQESVTSLLLAVQNKNASLVALLLSCGADPTFKYIEGMTCLHIATTAEDSDTVEKLLAATQSTTHIPKNDGIFPLEIAWQKKNKIIYHMIAHKMFKALPFLYSQDTTCFFAHTPKDIKDIIEDMVIGSWIKEQEDKRILQAKNAPATASGHTQLYCATTPLT